MLDASCGLQHVDQQRSTIGSCVARRLLANCLCLRCLCRAVLCCACLHLQPGYINNAGQDQGGYINQQQQGGYMSPPVQQGTFTYTADQLQQQQQ